MSDDWITGFIGGTALGSVVATFWLTWVVRREFCEFLRLLGLHEDWLRRQVEKRDRERAERKAGDGESEDRG